jgi:GNAT superfamily N-acetyltransferase
MGLTAIVVSSSGEGQHPQVIFQARCSRASPEGKGMAIRIRQFKDDDVEILVEILRLNGQYDHPEIEGPACMKRAARCDSVVFLVAEEQSQPRGFVRGVYDGARALIHLLSVHPKHQHRGIGSLLVDSIKGEFARRGSPGTMVTVSERSAPFWEKIGFQRLPVFVMLNDFSID